MELQDIVRRLRMKQSIKAIKRETGKHRRVIRRVLELAGQEGWLDAERELPSEHQLQKVYHEQRGGEDGRCHPLDARRDQIEGWRGDGYSFLVIHKLLQERGVEYSETTVRRYIHRHFPSPVRPVMRRETKPGEVMEVDFGHLGLTWDAATRSRKRTWAFSGRLRHSRRAYREVVFDQKQETFFACHMHAFEWFGGVSEKVTPDNLKAAIIVASFEDPLVNRAYRELALHYGFLISPCLPRRPEHKGGVEGDIKYVKRNFLPLFREAQKERGRETPDAGELGEELERWNRESYDLHVVQKVGRTPLELFESEEAQALTPLPMTRWDLVVCKELSVGPDWRVQFEKAFYTVPYRLIGERVLVLGNSQVVRIFLDFQEVTAHPRAKQSWQVMRRPEHAPPELEKYLNLTHAGLVQWASRLGPSVALVAQEIFADQAVDGMRPVRALIRLADKYTTQRLEAACRRAMHFATPSYRSVKNILVHELDRLPQQQPAQPEDGQIQFRFAREHGPGVEDTSMDELALLKPKLARLKLSGMLDTLSERLSQALAEKWSYTQFLDILLTDEAERRDFKQLGRRLTKSGLAPDKTLETFDFSFNPRIHAPTLRELATCRFVQRSENVFFVGPSGVGKSHAAQALGHVACRKGYAVTYGRTSVLLDWIHAGRGDGTYQRRLHQVGTVALLVLDDFGLTPLPEHQQQDLYEVICNRYERHATVITSNRDFNEWPLVFANPLMASATMDRLVHRAVKIVIEGKSYRMDSFVRRSRELPQSSEDPQ